MGLLQIEDLLVDFNSAEVDTYVWRHIVCTYSHHDHRSNGSPSHVFVNNVDRSHPISTVVYSPALFCINIVHIVSRKILILFNVFIIYIEIIPDFA